MRIRKSAKDSGNPRTDKRLLIEHLEDRQLLAVTAFPMPTSDGTPWNASDASIVASNDTTGGLTGYTIDLLANQRLTVAVTQSTTTRVFSLRDPSGSIVSYATLAAGQTYQLPTSIATTAGTWVVGVSSPVGLAGTYGIEAAINAVVELPDTTTAAPLILSNSVTPLLGGANRYAVYGKTNTDVDAFSIDLTGKVGHAIDLQVSGRNGENLSAQRLELISPSGAILATATVDPTNGKGLLLSNYTVPTSGVYSARVTSNLSASYLLTVTDYPVDNALSARGLLNYVVTNGWSTQTTVTGLVNTLDFDDVFQSAQTNELLSLLIAARLVNGYSDANGVLQALSGKGVDLTGLRPDGVMNALGNANGGSLFSWQGTSIGAMTAKGYLRDWFVRSPLRFLNSWTPDDLVKLFDDSITSTAGANASPINGLASWTTATGTTNLTAGYILWIHDSNGTTNVPNPVTTAAAVNAMPAGLRTIFATDYLEVLGYGGGRGYHDLAGITSGYVDPVTSTGTPATYYTIWMDQWQSIVQARVTAFFTAYKAAGGQLDYLSLDVEDTSLSYWDIIANERRVNVNSNPSQTFWQVTLADPRWPAIQAQLISAGLTASQLTLSAISNWNPEGREAAIWDGVMQDRLTAYLNAAVYQPVKQLFPDIKLSNYGSYDRTSTLPAGEYTQFFQSPFSDNPIVGNRSSAAVYGWSTDITTLDGVISPTTPFALPIKYISFAQHQTSGGAWTTSGTVTIQLFKPYTGLNAGDWITLENRGGMSFIDPQYLGKYQVYDVSSDGLTVRYILPIANATNPPPAKDLSNRPNSAYSAYVSTWRPYNAFVSDMSFIRTQSANSTIPQLPWITASDWLGRTTGNAYTYYPELIFQAALNGTENFLYWKDNAYGVNAAADVVLDNILKELNTLVGYADRKPLVYSAPSWSDGFVVSAVETNGKRIARLTPDPTKSVSVTASGGNVTFNIGGTVLTIPNATIYTPANPTSTLGYWIIQTQGTSNLTQSVSQINQWVASALAPIITAPTTGLRNVAQRFTISLNTALIAANSTVAMDIDWNGDGTTDQSIQVVGGASIDAYFSTIGVTNVRVTARLLDTNYILPTATRSITIVDSNLKLKANATNSNLNDLVFTGTAGSDQIVFEQVDATTVRVRTLKLNGATTSSIQIVSGVTGRVIASGSGGDDLLDASALTTTQATLDGGAGSNTLYGGQAGDVLIGGSSGGTGLQGSNVIVAGNGNNTIYGNSVTGAAGSTGGNNLIIGGTGNDVIYGTYGSVPNNGAEGGQNLIVGGGGADAIYASQQIDGAEGGHGSILITGRTTLNQAALASVLGEWTSTRTIAEKIANIQGAGAGTRNNGNNFLQAGLTVLDDGTIDQVFSDTNGQTNWLLYTAAADVLNRVKTSDITLNLP